MEAPRLETLSLVWLDKSLKNEFLLLLNKELDALQALDCEYSIICESRPLPFIAKVLSSIIAQKHVVIANPLWNNPALPAFDFSGYQDKKYILIPTGGSGGRIKFAMHSWETLAASAQATQVFLKVPIASHVSTLPLYAIGGLMPFIRAYVTGGIYYNLDHKNPPTEPYPSPAVLSVVPATLHALLESVPGWLGSFHAIFVGGGPMPPALMTSARQYELPVLKTYGMTETASMVACQKLCSPCMHPQCVGEVLPHATVRCGLSGELSIQSSSLFHGYYPNRLQDDSFFEPKDLGYFSDTGCLHIVGRSDTLIITGGKKIYPHEVRESLLDTGLVEDCLITSIHSPRWGQAIVAFYKAQVSHEAIVACLKPRVLPHIIPKHWVFVEKIPVNSQGKPDHAWIAQSLKNIKDKND